MSRYLINYHKGLASGNVLRFMKHVKISFDPFVQAKTAREFLRLTTNNAKAKLNPKCVVEHEILTNGASPKVDITFENGKKLVFSAEQPFIDMLSDLKFVVNTIAPDAEDGAADSSAAAAAKAPAKKK